MTIDKVSRVVNVYKTSGAKNISKSEASVRTDSIDISNEAKVRSLNEKYLNIVKNTPDIRTDRVAQAKENLGRYMSDTGLLEKVVDDIAGKISSRLL